MCHLTPALQLHHAALKERMWKVLVVLPPWLSIVYSKQHASAKLHASSMRQTEQLLRIAGQ